VAGTEIQCRMGDRIDGQKLKLVFMVETVVYGSPVVAAVLGAVNTAGGVCTVNIDIQGCRSDRGRR